MFVPAGIRELPSRTLDLCIALVTNVLRQPENPRFRDMNAGKAVIQTHLIGVPEAWSLLAGVGFVLTPSDPPRLQLPQDAPLEPLQRLQQNLSSEKTSRVQRSQEAEVQAKRAKKRAQLEKQRREIAARKRAQEEARQRVRRQFAEDRSAPRSTGVGSRRVPVNRRNTGQIHRVELPRGGG